jgi:ABC-type transporter Mla maintaining outer membrane lipid asymmetry permease subunit MlaE
MADTKGHDYGTSIGTKERSVVAATKIWAIILGLVALVGIVMMMMFLGYFGNARSSGPVSSENTATRPAEP